MPDLDLPFVRAQFPGLQQDEIFFDNAGGSFTLGRVADRIHDYLLQTPVQLGATYACAERAGQRYRTARARLAEFIGAARPEEVVFGPSSTILLKFLAQGLTDQVDPGDEIIVTRSDHEANIGCWIDLAARCGATIRYWELNPDTLELEVEDLQDLLGPRTRLVAVTHVSNVLGTLNPIAGITAAAHAHGAQVCVDGVAYAPHRELRLDALGADYYAFSLYKVFGPHHAILYGRHDRLRALRNLNHHFFTADQVPGKLEPGNANYELAHGAAGVVDYLEELGHRDTTDASPAAARTLAWDAIAGHEERLVTPLLAFLRDRDDVTIYGQPQPDPARRVPTVSFTSATRRSSDVVHAMDARRIGIRFGHFYAARLVEALGLPPKEGVIRVSMAHYNTEEEVHRLIDGLRDVL